jgi:hypothetical protein
VRHDRCSKRQRTADCSSPAPRAQSERWQEWRAPLRQQRLFPASQTSVKQINASSATAGSGDSLNPPPPRCKARRKAALRPCRKLKSVPNPREFTRAGRTIAIKQSFDKNGSRSTGSAVWEGDVVLTKYMQVRCPQRLDTIQEDEGSVASVLMPMLLLADPSMCAPSQLR